MKKAQIFLAGLFKENPVLVMFLGMCPTLAVSTNLDNAIGMGIAVIIVLLLSNIVISLIKKLVPNEIRIPIYIVVIATFVKIIDLLMHAFTPDLYASLGIFIPLIVVNCIILGRAEAFASKNSVWDSILDALGMGLGFTLALLLISGIRQFIGTGALFISNPFNPTQILFSTGNLLGEYVFGIFQTPAGAFLVLGFIVAALNAFRLNREKKKVLTQDKK